MTKRGKKKKIHRYGRGYGQEKESLSLAWHISEIKKKEKNTERENKEEKTKHDKKNQRVIVSIRNVQVLCSQNNKVNAQVW